MTIEELELLKKNLIRLPGCILYQPGDGRRIDGGRAVYVQKSSDTQGLAVVSRRVVAVAVIDRDASTWRIAEETAA